MIKSYKINDNPTNRSYKVICAGCHNELHKYKLTCHYVHKSRGWGDDSGTTIDCSTDNIYHKDRIMFYLCDKCEEKFIEGTTHHRLDELDDYYNLRYDYFKLLNKYKKLVKFLKDIDYQGNLSK